MNVIFNRPQFFAGLIVACTLMFVSFTVQAQTAEPSLRVFDVWAKTTVPTGSALIRFQLSLKKRAIFRSSVSAVEM